MLIPSNFRLFRPAWVVGVYLAFVAIAFGQSTGAIQGTVTDPSGAAEAPDTDAAAKRATPVVRKPQPAPAAAPASPPADNAFTRSLQFLREVKIELKKVTWPSRQQTMGSTLVVIVLVMIISLFLGLVDLGLSTVIRSLFR